MFPYFHYPSKDLVFDIKVNSIDTKLLDDVSPCTFSLFPKFWSSLHIILLNSFCILVSQTWKSDFETKPSHFAFTAWLLKHTHRKKYSFPLEMPHMKTLKMPKMKTLTMPQMTTLKKPQMTTLKMSHMKTLKMLQMKTWQSVLLPGIRPPHSYSKEEITLSNGHIYSLTLEFPNRAIHLRQVTVTCRAWTTPKPSQRPIEPPTSARRLLKGRD